MLLIAHCRNCFSRCKESNTNALNEYSASIEQGSEVFAKKNGTLNIQIRGSIVVSISACHADDPGSIPGRGVFEVNARVEEDEGFLDVQMFWRLWEWATSS